MECCLCNSDLGASKKKKKLYGASCKAARETLLIEMKGFSLEHFVTTSDPKTFLCTHCETMLRKLDEARTYVAGKISRLHLKTQKRSSEVILSGPPTKQICFGAPDPEHQQTTASGPSMAMATASSPQQQAPVGPATQSESPGVKVSL